MDDNENELFNQNSPLLSPFNDKQNNSLSINIDIYNLHKFFFLFLIFFQYLILNKVII